MTKSIQLPGSIDGASTRKDGSMGLRVSTQELTPKQKVMLMEYVGKFGWFLFKPSETAFTDEELPVDDPEEPRTLSQRLRAVIFLYGRDVKGIPADDKDRTKEFYRQQMEKLIGSFKTMLPK